LQIPLADFSITSSCLPLVWPCYSAPFSMSTTTTAELLDPSSAAYKKARRQFYKATKNRPTVDQDWTPFRAAEKRFKARFPPPDLSQVLDLAQLDESRQQELAQGVWQGSASPFEYKRLSGSSNACVIPAIPGAQASPCTSLPIPINIVPSASAFRPRYLAFLP
jgi:hypothetical protein